MIPTLALRRDRWPLERALFAMAGTVTLLSALLSGLVSPWFLVLTGFVGVNQWLYVSAGACPASIALKRACGLRSSLYPQAVDQSGSGRHCRLTTPEPTSSIPRAPLTTAPRSGRPL
jgi:hypothetical protein